MAQIKIYGIRDTLIPRRAQLSNIIHECVMEALEFPADKRAHRFFPMDKDDFLYPGGRSDDYIVIEIMMMEGRTVAARKQLIRLLNDNIHRDLGISLQDIEIVITESPACNWSFRGIHGDEASLSYRVDI
ncbi:tautomerase family protein [Aurantivibrio plasticivorans]